MKVFKHLLFWMMIIVLLTLVFGSSYGSYVQPFFFVLMMFPVIAGTSYFFNNHLVSNFLFKKKTFKFILYSVYMLVISLYLQMLIVTLAFIFLANYQYKNMIPLATDASVLAIALYAIVFLYGFMLLAKRTVANQKTIQALTEEKKNAREDFLQVRANRKNQLILQKNIGYLESLGDYVKINIMEREPVVTKEKISKLEIALSDSFVRIHRSYIINIDKVQAYDKERVQIGDSSLPISRTYKKKVMHVLNKQVFYSPQTK